MKDVIRRQELGKYFLDISKYVLTVVVIGSVTSDVLNLRLFWLGIGIGVIFMVVGYWVLPLKVREEA